MPPKLWANYSFCESILYSRRVNHSQTRKIDFYFESENATDTLRKGRRKWGLSRAGDIQVAHTLEKKMPLYALWLFCPSLQVYSTAH